MGDTMIDETGNRYGRLTVLSLAHKKRQTAHWKCQCDCGKIVVVAGYSLRSGKTQSCGCLHREISSARTKHMVGELHPCWGKRGPECPNWRSGRYIDRGGYVRALSHGHPRADAGNYVMEHILVMEKMLGHPVPDGAVIHHCNGDKTDNRPYNLRLFSSSSEHMRYHRKREWEMDGFINGLMTEREKCAS